MDADLWRKLETLFHAALDLTGSARSEFVSAVAAEDRQLGRELESLLRARGSAGGILQCGIGDVADAWMREQGRNSLAAGAVLGPYELREFIAAGGMGEVYKAFDRRLKRHVAIKTLRAACPGNLHQRERFIREARAASSLNHPNIITIHDIGEIDGLPFIVMEYVSGRTLSQFVPMDACAAVRVGSQIAAALARAHSAGITHRDLKPGNVMVTRDGAVKVLDFGLAALHSVQPGDATETLLPGLTLNGSIVGTPGYMSPEQAAGRPVDARSDIFSFGVLLWELLCGHRLEVAQDQPARETGCSGIPPALEQICTRCLHPDPSMRFQSMLDVKIALDSGIPQDRASDFGPSIAVLPFVNLSSDDQNDFFGDGLAEDIIELLTRNPLIRVTAPASSFRFRNREADIREIARKLSVEHVLDGSVRKFGGRIRVTARLMRATDEFRLWSDRFDADLTDVFKVQDEIAGAIAKALKAALSAEMIAAQHRRYKPSSEAYSAYLEGRYHLHKLMRGELMRAKQCFESAIDLDPNYAAAYSGLALYHWWNGEAAQDGSSQMEFLLQRALELDPALSEAHALRGAILALHHYDWHGAENEFQLALTCHPVPADAYYHYAQCFLLPLGRFDEALFALHKARQLDPLSPTLVHAPTGVYSCRGEFRKVIEQCTQTLELDDRFWFARLNTGWALLGLGDIKGAREKFEALATEVGAQNGLVVYALGACLAHEGRLGEAREVLNRYVEAHSQQEVSPWLLASYFLQLGNLDRTFSLIDQAVDQRDPRVFWFVFEHHLFAPDLRGDPRFHQLLNRLNLTGAVISPQARGSN